MLHSFQESSLTEQSHLEVQSKNLRWALTILQSLRDILLNGVEENVNVKVSWGNASIVSTARTRKWHLRLGAWPCSRVLQLSVAFDWLDENVLICIRTFSSNCLTPLWPYNGRNSMKLVQQLKSDMTTMIMLTCVILRKTTMSKFLFRTDSLTLMFALTHFSSSFSSSSSSSSSSLFSSFFSFFPFDKGQLPIFMIYKV